MSEAARSVQLVERPALSDAERAVTLPVVAAPIDPLDGIPTKIAARALAMAEIVAAFRGFRNRSCKALNAAGKDFCERFNHGQIEVSASAREVWQSIEWPTLQKAWRKFEKAGIGGLIPGYGKRRGDSIITRNALMREFVIAQIAHNPIVRAPFVLEGIEARFPNDQIPSIDTVQKFIRDWKRGNRSLYQRIEDPAGWRNKHMLALGEMDAVVTRVGQLWEIDGSPADCYVLGTESSPGGRLHLLVAIDKCSRKMVALLAPSESSDSLAALLIKAIPILGMPDEIRHDNGAGFVSERTQRGVARLGIAWPATPAYAGWKKPFIERGQGTLLHSFFENVPGFIGHDVKGAAKIRERNGYAPGRGERRNMRKLYRIELSAPELQDLLDKWIEHVYGNRKHRGLGGRTPNEVFAEADRRGQVRRVADDRTLDLLLGEDGVGVVGKNGLRVDNAFFWGDALAEHVGATVQFVKTRDAGKLIVYTADSAPRFVCIAENPEALGLDREVMAIAGKQRQAAVMREGMDELRALKRKHKPQNSYRDIVDSAAARSFAQLSTSAKPGTEIAALPHRSSGIAMATAALEALDAAAEVAPHSEEVMREGAEALAKIEAQREARAILLDAEECDALWIAIRGEPRALTLREQHYLAHFNHSPEVWATNYETTDEFRALMMGREWLGREDQHGTEDIARCAKKSA
jgi:putative transposase